MKFHDILSVLHDLSGTPLKSVDMNRIQSVRNLDKKLNLSVVAIPNMTLTHLAIDDSAMTSLVGQLSKIQPSLTSLSLSTTSNYDDSLYSLLDAVLFMPNLRKIHVYGYLTQSVFNIIQKTLLIFLLENINLPAYLKQYHDTRCHLQTKIKMSPELTTASFNNIRTGDFADSTERSDTKPLCFHEDNKLVHLDLSNSFLGKDLRLISGLHQLEILNVRNTENNIWYPGHLLEFPRLKILFLSDNIPGKYIAMDVNATIFRHGGRLVVLDLARCNLTLIPYQEFSALTSLQYLNLSGNQIQFANWLLKNSNQLKLLNLRRNQIEKLPENFTSNQLDALVNSQISVPNSSVLEIDLRENPISCLCNASSFVRWVQLSRKKITFTGLVDYMCLYPNGSWLNLATVDTYLLEEQCKVVSDVVNNTKCPCEYDKLQLLYDVRYSLSQFYCNYSDGTSIQMKLLQPNVASKVCLTTTPRFVIPVLVVASIVIIVIITVVFIAVYRYRKPQDFQQIIACLDPGRLTGALIALLADIGQTDEEMNIEVSYDAYFAYYSGQGYQLDQEVISKLTALGLKIVTEEEILPGALISDILEEVTSKCRSMVLVLTPEFMTDPGLCNLTKRALVSRCAIVPLVYRRLELNEDELLFTNILKTHFPIYWPEDNGDWERVLRELTDRLLDDTRTRVGKLLSSSHTEYNREFIDDNARV